MSKTEKYSKMKALFNSIDGLDLHDKRDGNFKFIVYQNEKYKDIDVEALDLSVRSSNCLKRAGIKNVYDLMTEVNGRTDLLKIRNCGENSSREIMENLFLFQYAALKPEQRGRYIERIIEMNHRD